MAIPQTTRPKNVIKISTQPVKSTNISGRHEGETQVHFTIHDAVYYCNVICILPSQIPP